MLTKTKERPLTVLSPTRYPWTFNSPRHSRNRIVRRSFLPLNKVAPKLEGMTLYAALPWEKFDLIHAFNRIPVDFRPFVIGFESHLPRAFNLEQTTYYRLLRRRLASRRCKRIVAISERAKETFLHFHSGSDEFDELASKLEVRYPNVVLPNLTGKEVLQRSEGPLKITFVGNHFGRKGGCVAVRLAHIAQERGFPLEVTIVSKLEAGTPSWTDPLRTGFFERYFKLFELPNVTLHRGLANDDVQALLGSSDFSLLTTFSDTFGYSAIESLAAGTPVIATRQGALPEFLSHLDNAILFDLELDEFGDWVHSSSDQRGTSSFERLFEDEVERLASETYASLESLINDRPKLSMMRKSAVQTAAKYFDSVSATRYWDNLYDQSTS
ncbi:glycosyltransferase family 4 protein [Hyphomicrobium sp. CS1GBMeth3]|uniref:glycosyltransferase family 4 protein n=1 Tax=Hyphomicrobium sp. CS1GBMeth3 TaxID=1892845 RepID=UPI000930DA3D|nr:glycosyltransferase family 4 protein [Hyphomicrobium sp. CS1GBMeth3]